MNSKPFATQVIERMTELGWSMKELARQSGVSYDIINKMKQRPESSTKADNGRKLAKALGLDWHGTDHEVAGVGDLVSVYDVQASAGHGALVGEESIIDRLAFPPGYLASITGTNPRHLAIIKVTGSSMVPTMAHGDVVMLDTTKTSLGFDGIFVMRFDGALHVKRVGRSSEPGVVRIMSDNRSENPEFERRIDVVEVIGKVVWMGKKV